MKTIAILIALFIPLLSFGQPIAAEIDSIYNFKPAKLSGKEQESKLPSLDNFWEKVKSDTTKYLPQLRTELLQSGHNPFFYFDGSALMLSLSQNQSDKELAVQAITRCDLEDINRRIYVSTLSKLAQENIDVTSAAVRILEDDMFSFSLPQHAMSFNQGYCLAYMLLPMESKSYVDTLIAKFPSLSIKAKKSIITTLWFTYSCNGDIFLKSVLADQEVEKEVRDYTKKLTTPVKLTKDQREYLELIGKENIDLMRRLALQRFSDEAIAELDLSTRVIRSQKKCQ
jgi:hypothetical protein